MTPVNSVLDLDIWINLGNFSVLTNEFAAQFQIVKQIGCGSLTLISFLLDDPFTLFGHCDLTFRYLFCIFAGTLLTLRRSHFT